MTEVAFYMAVGVYLPYGMAIALALRARSRSARRLVLIVAPIMLASISANLILTSGCKITDLMLQSCPYIGKSLLHLFSVGSLLLLPLHFVLMPFLALVALALEWWSRRASRKADRAD